MKKFIISEEEKQRILNLHEIATKRNYISEQNSPNTQAQKAGTDRKTIYNQDLEKWRTNLFPFTEKQLTDYANQVTQKQIDYSKIKDFSNDEYYKAIDKIMNLVDPTGWQKSKDSSYSNYGSYISQVAGAAIPTIVTKVNETNRGTLALVQYKFNNVKGPNYPKDVRYIPSYKKVLESAGITDIPA